MNPKKQTARKVLALMRASADLASATAVLLRNTDFIAGSMPIDTAQSVLDHMQAAFMMTSGVMPHCEEQFADWFSELARVTSAKEGASNDD